MAPRICNVTLTIFALLYAGAVVLFLVGTFGWFGQQTDPLSGVFLLPLGLPWVFMADALDDTLRPWAAVLAPAVNLAILAGLCRLASARRGP